MFLMCKITLCVSLCINGTHKQAAHSLVLPMRVVHAAYPPDAALLPIQH